MSSRRATPALHETSGADGRSGIPDDREGHSASVIGTKIYVFGGTWNDDDENAAVTKPELIF